MRRERNGRMLPERAVSRKRLLTGNIERRVCRTTLIQRRHQRGFVDQWSSPDIEEQAARRHGREESSIRQILRGCCKRAAEKHSVGKAYVFRRQLIWMQHVIGEWRDRAGAAHPGDMRAKGFQPATDILTDMAETIDQPSRLADFTKRDFLPVSLCLSTSARSAFAKEVESGPEHPFSDGVGLYMADGVDLGLLTHRLEKLIIETCGDRLEPGKALCGIDGFHEVTHRRAEKGIRIAVDNNTFGPFAAPWPPELRTIV